MSSQITLVFNCEDNIKAVENKKRSVLRQKLKYIKELITIEPLLFCYLIGIVISDPPTNNLELEMACRTNSMYNESVCESVVKATHAENNFTIQNSQVQQYVSDMLSWSASVQNVLPVLLLLFLGSYSDRHKMRKPFLLLPIFGEIFANICYIVCAIFKDVWPVSSIGIVYIISSSFGGSSLITMSAISYIADISSTEMRMTRISVLEVFIYLSAPLGLTFSGILYDNIGYIPTLLTACGLHILAFVYGILLVKEPKESQESKSSSLKDLIKDLANPEHALSTIKLLTNSKGAQRVNLIFILVILYIYATVVGGEYYVFFYFTQHAYGWDYSQFSIFLAAGTIMNAIGLTVGAIILSKMLHLDDLIIIAIAFVCKILANVIFAVARSGWQLYIGVVVSTLQEAAGAGIRSQSTKYVSEEDIGKSQSLLSIGEAIAYAVAAAIYHQAIYTYTRDTHIQAFFYFGIVLYAFGIIFIVWRYLNNKEQPSNR